MLSGFLCAGVWPARAQTSETNRCPLCWERSYPNGPCDTPLPKGAPVPGQPCKECDGQGGITNKADGIYDQIGCCNGVPYNPARQGCCDTGKGPPIVTTNSALVDPCEVAKNLPEYHKGAFGAAVCYNGHVTPCVFEDNIPSSWDDWVKDCIMAHEEVHASDPTYHCWKCDPHVGGWTNRQEGRAGECKAYRATMNCLATVPDSLEGKEELQRMTKEGIDENCTGP